jgi:hypothetical protein
MHIIVTLLLAVMIFGCSYHFYVRRIGASHFVGRKAEPLGFGTAERLQRMAGRERMVSSAQAQIFALAVTDPTLVRQRVVDAYEPNRRSLHKKVTVDLQLSSRLGTSRRPAGAANGSDAEVGAVFLPVVIRKKGDFLDSLRVSDASDSLLPVLSYSEYLVLVAGTLRGLLASACERGDGSLPPAAIEAERHALEAIAWRGTRESGSTVTEILSLPNAKQAALQMAARFVRRLEQNYAIVVSAAPDRNRRVLFRYEETTVPAMTLAAWRTSIVHWLRDRLRLHLGARPVSISVGLENAWTCRSYHLRIDATDDLYLSGQEIQQLEDLKRQQSRPGAVTPHYRFRSRLGQSYLHFYGRFLAEPAAAEPTKQPTITARFSEVPPGTVFRAAIAAGACLAIVWIVARMWQIADPQTDAPAFLLAFPAVAATWLGFDAPNSRLLEGTLAARLSLLTTFAVSLLASGLFIASKSNLHLLPGTLPWTASFLGVRRTDWALLVMAALLNFAFVTYCHLTRAYTFIALVTGASRRRAKLRPEPVSVLDPH